MGYASFGLFQEVVSVVHDFQTLIEFGIITPFKIQVHIFHTSVDCCLLNSHISGLL